MRPVERFGSREVPRSGQDRSLQSSRERCTVGRGLDPSGDIAGRGRRPRRPANGCKTKIPPPGDGGENHENQAAGFLI